MIDGNIGIKLVKSCDRIVKHRSLRRAQRVVEGYGYRASAVWGCSYDAGVAGIISLISGVVTRLIVIVLILFVILGLFLIRIAGQNSNYAASRISLRQNSLDYSTSLRDTDHTSLAYRGNRGVTALPHNAKFLRIRGYGGGKPMVLTNFEGKLFLAKRYLVFWS
jgi:hypothetical protein